jgi:hypothetical protein
MDAEVPRKIVDLLADRGEERPGGRVLGVGFWVLGDGGRRMGVGGWEKG